VFEGAFLLDAVAAVVDLGPASGDPSDALLELVDANLLQLDPAGAGEPRFVTSALTRGFARGRLHDHEWAAVRDRHARYFSDRGKAGLEVVREEWADIVAALDHEMDTGRFDDALATAVALAPEVQEVPGAVASLEQRITDLLESNEHVPPRLYARALMWSTHNHPDGASADVQRFGLWTAQRLAEATALAREAGDGPALLEALERTIMLLRITLDLPAAVSAAHEGLELARRLDDGAALARFECFMSMSALSVGDAERAAQLATSSITRGREHDDAFARVAACQLLLSMPEELRPALQPPLPSLEELLAQCERLEQPFTGMTVLASLAHEGLTRGDPTSAARWLWRLLMIGANRQRTEPMATLGAVALLLSAALVLGETDDAAKLREYTRPLEMFVPYCLGPSALPRYQQDTAYLDASVPDPRRTELAREVTTMGVSGINRWAQEVARHLAGHRPPRPSTARAKARPGPRDPLTPREREVLAAIATGRTNREIAEELGMTAKTVMHHSVAIYRKLDVRGRAAATAWAYEHGLAAER
jgi:DNA-binding CsgD family transcriptional regulator